MSLVDRRRGVVARRIGKKPIVGANLLTNGDGSNLTVYTTGSFTALGGTLLLIFNDINNGTTTRTGTFTGTGLTFTSHQSYAWGPTNNRIEVHSAPVPGAGFTGTLTLTCSGSAQQALWSVIQVTGARPTSPVVQVTAATIGTGTSGTATLAAAADAANRTFGAAAHATVESSSAPSGWTLISQIGIGSPATELHSFYHPSTFQTSINPSWPTGSVYGIIGCEIAAA